MKPQAGECITFLARGTGGRDWTPHVGHVYSRGDEVGGEEYFRVTGAPGDPTDVSHRAVTEGALWLRGHHELDSPEVKALLVSGAMWEGT